MESKHENKFRADFPFYVQIFLQNFQWLPRGDVNNDYDDQRYLIHM